MGSSCWANNCPSHSLFSTLSILTNLVNNYAAEYQNSAFFIPTKLKDINV